MKHLTVRSASLTPFAALAVALLAAGPSGAQSATTTAAPPPAPAPDIGPVPSTATPQMIEEAIQRSQLRAARARTQGKPEQWGSEEPYTYIPGRRY